MAMATERAEALRVHEIAQTAIAGLTDWPASTALQDIEIAAILWRAQGSVRHAEELEAMAERWRRCGVGQRRWDGPPVTDPPGRG